ncbi:MAG: PA0069 family radical SAM protein [Polyangiaceae bacterium]|nr:PA0069 family radical SAM protein [Polyangiaceae bacterium]
MRPIPVSNPPNPWAKATVEWLGEPPNAPLCVFEEHAKSIVNEVESPDVGMMWSLNPYRGCQHACAYCYARPTHQYWGFGAGTDFDRNIVVKVNAAALLRETFEKKSWQGQAISFSGNTDCYQPLEASYELTRACLKVCFEYQNPVGVITKSALIRRDIELLAALHKRARVGVTLSIPFADDGMGRAIEPLASACSNRFETIRRLVDAGIPTGVNVAPMIPGLNDTQMVEVLERAKEAGAHRAGMILLRLPKEVLPVFVERLDVAFPERAGKVKKAILEMRGGKMNEGEFGSRMEGKGPRWEVISNLFDLTVKRLGFETRGAGSDSAVEAAATFERPRAQQELFK